jgi:hypothetical protein
MLDVQFEKGQEDAWLDPEYRREKIAEFRKAAAEAAIPPGAWVLHYKRTNTTPDYCPDRPHLHIFIRGSLPRNFGFGLYTLQIRKPGLIGVLRGCTRGYSPGMKTEGGGKPKDRALPFIGWFGRRSAKGGSGAVPKSEPVRFCHTCNREVPKYEWEYVETPVGIEKEASWDLPAADVRVLRPDFMPRGGADEEAFDHRPRFYTSVKP